MNKLPINLSPDNNNEEIILEMKFDDSELEMQFDRRSERYESSSFRRNRSSDPRKALRMFEEEKTPWNGSCIVPSANTNGLEEPYNYRKMSMNSAED